MTIGKKLYMNFGIILVAVVLLLVVNLVAVWREHDTKAATQRSLNVTDATSAVRFEMMQNRMHLQNYLLSGDTRDVDKMNDGIRRLNEDLRKAQEMGITDQQKSNLEKFRQLEQDWNTEFASSLIDKRRQVDGGNATVAELQIFYLQKDPNSWVTRSSEVLDQVDKINHDELEKERNSDDLASKATIVITVVATLLALGIGIVIAYRTAQAISQPLSTLAHVARQIGESGDLDHNIDLRGEDEIGQLARTFDAMVKYLKEMATVSEAIAGGNLTVEVHARSAND